MERKDDLLSNRREEAAEGVDPLHAEPEHAALCHALLGQALEQVLAHTRDVLPPDGFEARLLARAEASELLAPAKAAASRPMRIAPPPERFRQAGSRWAWAPVAFAAIALAFWIGTPRRLDSPSVARPESMTTRTGDQAAPVAAGGAAAPKADVAVAASRRLPKRSQPVAQAAKHVPRVAANPAVLSEVHANEPLQPRYSEFVPLEFASAFREGEALQTVRVRIDADDFLRWGLPGSAIGRVTQLVHDSPVTADFLVGDDGSPRAIRLVSMDE